MRVTAGKYKNRKIVTKNKTNKDLEYRPTAERSRLAIFNILENSKNIPEGLLKDANVMDLFCGCGSFGIEAISRGARHVYFIDKASEQFELVKQNLDSIGEIEKATFYRADATNLSPINFKANFVYIDPPYNRNLCHAALKSILNSGVLDNNSIVILERSYKEDVKDVEKLEKFDERRYGKSVIAFYKYVA